MEDTYRWPDPQAVETINALLRLPATSREQDWEVELADSDCLDQALVLFQSGGLDLECRSALALLMLHSLTYHHGGHAGASQRIEQVRGVLIADTLVWARMSEYWAGGFGEHESVVKAVLT